MIRNCPECSKEFDVLYPDLWRYKREKTYYCSWKCLRATEKPERRSEENMDNKKHRGNVQNEEAVKVALAGGNPLKYLENCGSRNPSAAWYAIKQKVKEKDPETYAKLPARNPRKDAAVKKEPKPTLADAMEGMKDAADEFFGKCEDMGLSLGKDEAPEEPKITKAVVFDNMTIREVEGGFGRYRRSDVHGSIYLDFEQTDGADVISLTVNQWRSLREELNRAAAILGVEL